MLDLANVLLALAGLVTAIGGAVAGIIAAIRATDHQRRDAAASAVAHFNPGRHALREETTNAYGNTPVSVSNTDDYDTTPIVYRQSGRVRHSKST